MSKHLVITGGTSGIGQAAVQSLIAEGWEVTLLARDQKKVEKLKDRFKTAQINGIKCDLSSMQSVKEAADALMNLDKKIDVLMNNAGGIFQRKQQTVDGLEMTFGVNHLSHFLLTTQLMDQLIKDKSRIININRLWETLLRDMYLPSAYNMI